MGLNVVFIKMCGAGNDFLITDSSCIYKSSGDIQNLEDLVSKIPELCDRKFGIGADGICLLTSQNDFIDWQFFNSDGSEASMCGNAACCITHYAYTYGLRKTPDPVILKIKNKTLEGSLDSKKRVRIRFDLPQHVKKNQSIKLNGEQIFFDQVQIGVDHIVIESEKVHIPNSLKDLSRLFRKKYPNYNITFYKKERGNKINGITFERGVEDFTLACGTGALAIASISKDHMLFDIMMPGGVLNVQLKGKYAFLSSPVKYIAEVTPQLKTYH